MKIVMTGATGYIGGKVLERLADDGHQVYAVVRNASRLESIKDKVAGVVYSTPYLQLYEAFAKIQPDAYINLAGSYAGKHTPEKIQGLFDGNVILPTYVTDAVVKAGCRKVIHTASYQQCYHGAPYSPVNLYAATKQSFEDVLLYYAACEGVCAITLQLFDTYGADDTRRKVFNLVRMLQEGEHLGLSPGEQKLYFCYISDVVEAYITALELLEKQEAGTYHRYAVRGESPVSLKEFAEKYCVLSGKRLFLDWGARDYMDREIMDPTGYGEVLPGWHPNISYEQGLMKCAKFDSL